MTVAVLSNGNEVLIFALGPAPEYERIGKEEYSDRDWNEYDVETVELPLRIRTREGFIVDQTTPAWLDRPRSLPENSLSKEGTHGE
jgi:hypothetical protein